MKGIVVHWNARGFGFIYSDETKRRVFFHVSSLTGAAAPEINQVVTFDLAGDAKRQPDKAINVKIVSTTAGLTALAASNKAGAE